MLAHAVPVLTGGADAALASWLGAGLAALSGAGLIVGVLTPFMATGVGLSALVMAVLPPPHLDTRLPADWPGLLLTAADAVALTMLGPGALSFDARLFGRREIVVRDAAHRRPKP